MKSTPLSVHFTLEELTHSETAERKGLDNTPNETVIANLKVLCEQVLQPVREHYGKSVKVNSGYRSPEVNASVGGSKTSDHCKGQAADIEITGIANGDLAKYIVENFKFTQVILEFYTQGIPDSGWVHVSYDPMDLKCQALTAVKKDGKTVYLPGLQV
jgi:zinc D-Ala-D-Ala carboxypeptidase